MEKKLILVLTFLLFLLPLMAITDDSIKTVFQEGHFRTQYKTKVKASEMIASDMANDLLKDFHSTPANLFNWALKDLGLQDKKKE